MSGKKSTKGQKVKKVARPLPKIIHDKLRMACILKSYSAINCGGENTLSKQHSDLSKFYNGEKPNHPSQIALLCNASYTYMDMYDTIYHVATKKNNNV